MIRANCINYETCGGVLFVVTDIEHLPERTLTCQGCGTKHSILRSTDAKTGVTRIKVAAGSGENRKFLPVENY